MSSLSIAVHRCCAGATDGESCPWGGGRADALLVTSNPLECAYLVHACSSEHDGMVHPALLQGVWCGGMRAAPPLIELLISRFQCCKLTK